jgi:hypothetical protein
MVIAVEVGECPLTTGEIVISHGKIAHTKKFLK